MSWLRYLTLYSCRKYNPDLEIRLYNSPAPLNKKPWDDYVTQDFFSYNGNSFFSKLDDLDINIIPWNTPENMGEVSPVHKCDLFQWEILAKEGGYYGDMDLLFLNSLDSMHEEICANNYDIAISWDIWPEEIVKIGHPRRPGYYSIGFMGAEPETKLFKALTRISKLSYRIHNESKEYESAGVWVLYDNCPSPDDIVETFLGKPYFIPKHLFYSIDSFEIVKFYEGNFRPQIPDNAIAIHYYGGHPLSQSFNTMVNEDNYKLFNNTIGSVIKEILT